MVDTQLEMSHMNHMTTSDGLESGNHTLLMLTKLLAAAATVTTTTMTMTTTTDGKGGRRDHYHIVRTGS